VHDARHRRVAIEHIEVGEGEDGLGADEDGEITPQLLECCSIDAGYAPGERCQCLVDEREAIARPNRASRATGDRDGYERAYAASFPWQVRADPAQAGHLPHLEQPERVLEAIHRFAAETTRSATSR
jgi:pimeloyl-ACP methyl ester carboxylesterase